MRPGPPVSAPTPAQLDTLRLWRAINGPRAIRQGGGAAGMERTSHILVVDDHREIRELLAKYLVKNGFRVSTASGGAEMRQHMRPVAPDLARRGNQRSDANRRSAR
jgi:hypothetical protein